MLVCCHEFQHLHDALPFGLLSGFYIHSFFFVFFFVVVFPILLSILLLVVRGGRSGLSAIPKHNLQKLFPRLLQPKLKELDTS
jgi:hypothetical protein